MVKKLSFFLSFFLSLNVSANDDRLTKDDQPISTYSICSIKKSTSKPSSDCLTKEEVQLIGVYTGLGFQPPVGENYSKLKNWLRKVSCQMMGGEYWENRDGSHSCEYPNV